MDYLGKKIFSPVRFTMASGAFFVENYLLMTQITVHALTLSFPLFS